MNELRRTLAQRELELEKLRDYCHHLERRIDENRQKIVSFQGMEKRVEEALDEARRANSALQDSLGRIEKLKKRLRRRKHWDRVKSAFGKNPPPDEDDES